MATRGALQRAKKALEGVSEKAESLRSAKYNKKRPGLKGIDTSDILIKAPVVTVVLCLVVTGFFIMHSGINDCREGYNPSW